MKKLIAVLLGFTLAISVASPVMAQQSEAASATRSAQDTGLTAEEAGRLAALYLNFRLHWHNVIDDTSVRKSSSHDEITQVMDQFERHVVDVLAPYLRENVQQPPKTNGTYGEITWSKPARDAAAMMLAFDRMNVQRFSRSSVYEALSNPWPKSRYDNWTTLNDEFSKTIRTSPLEGNHDLMGELLGLYVEMSRLFKKAEGQPKWLFDITGALRLDLAYYLNDLISVDSTKAYNSIDEFTRGTSRGELYKIMGSPWPVERYAKWNIFYNSFEHVIK